MDAHACRQGTMLFDSWEGTLVKIRVGNLAEQTFINASWLWCMSLRELAETSAMYVCDKHTCNHGDTSMYAQGEGKMRFLPSMDILL